jgi:hypothetical protein
MQSVCLKTSRLRLWNTMEDGNVKGNNGNPFKLRIFKYIIVGTVCQ